MLDFRAGVTTPGHVLELLGRLYKKEDSQFSTPEVLFRRYLIKGPPGDSMTSKV